MTKPTAFNPAFSKLSCTMHNQVLHRIDISLVCQSIILSCLGGTEFKVSHPVPVTIFNSTTFTDALCCRPALLRKCCPVRLRCLGH